MESLQELSKSSSSKNGFVSHVFKFDDEAKSEILNMIQYALLALIPVVLLNKVTNKFIPEADDEKGSLEISVEVIGQIILMFIGILFIHRLVTFVPTFSGAKYADFHITNIILAMLVIILSLQTKLGEKISILVDRISDLWNGGSKKDKKRGTNANVKVSQPIVQQGASTGHPTMNTALNSMGTTSISSLPSTGTGAMPDYNAMHKQDPTPLIGAATPGQSEGFGMMGGPMAANDGFGAFSSAFGSSW